MEDVNAGLCGLAPPPPLGFADAGVAAAAVEMEVSAMPASAAARSRSAVVTACEFGRLFDLRLTSRLRGRGFLKSPASWSTRENRQRC